jgi:OOP family OmpA-OmpF porin
MFAHKTPWIVLLVVWIGGAIWWHVCKIKQLCADARESAAVVNSTSDESIRIPPLLISDGTRFQLDLPGNFSFAQSDANAVMGTLLGSLDSLTAYLKANPGRTLTITGYYLASEKNKTSLSNLGAARAEAIKQYLEQQGVAKRNLTATGRLADESQPGIITAMPKGDSLYGGLAFTFGGNEPAVATAATTTDTVLTDLTVAEKAVAEKAVPEKTDVEKTTVEKREKSDKKEDAKAEKTPASVAEKPVTGPIPKTEEGLAAAEKYKSVFTPISLYFPLNEANYISTGETKKFFKEASDYLKKHKNKKLQVTGYTDNAGPNDVNLRLSRDRANSVKQKLRKSGIRADQITVVAKGEKEPKYSNDSREGRKANRRVSVVVQ